MVSWELGSEPWSSREAGDFFLGGGRGASFWEKMLTLI